MAVSQLMESSAAYASTLVSVRDLQQSQVVLQTKQIEAIQSVYLLSRGFGVRADSMLDLRLYRS